MQSMTATIFGLGIGLFTILSLWILAALVLLISLRIAKKIGICAIVIVSFLTIILISVPRSSERSIINNHKLYDRLFIWRIILLIVLSISTLVGLIGYIKFKLLEPVRPVRIKSWVF